MTPKRGQITVFIMMGIIIVAATGLFFFMKSNSQKVTDDTLEQTYNDDLDLAMLKEHVEMCIKGTAVEGISSLSRNGGYYKLPPVPEGLDGWSAYYYLKGNVNVPDVATIEKQMQLYIDDFLPFCLQEINISGYEIISSDPRSEVIIGKDDMIIKLKSPASIQSGDKKKTIRNFQVSVSNKPIIPALAAAKAITENTVENLPYVCISCVSEIAFGQGFNASITSSNNTLYFEIGNYSTASETIFDYLANLSSGQDYVDENVGEVEDGSSGLAIEKEAYLFSFAIDVRGHNSPQEDLYNKEIKIMDIPDLVAYVGETKTYQINATGNDLSYESFTYGVDIDKNGLLSYTPLEEDLGNHTAFIAVSDDDGNYDQKEFMLVVRNKE